MTCPIRQHAREPRATAAKLSRSLDQERSGPERREGKRAQDEVSPQKPHRNAQDKHALTRILPLKKGTLALRAEDDNSALRPCGKHPINHRSPENVS